MFMSGSNIQAEQVPPARSQGWQARLELAFTQRKGSTVLENNRHTGPLRLQRPLYPEKAVCHACILHPPGGVVGGDQLVIDAVVKTGAAALITTPGATKFYRSAGEVAVQENCLVVSNGGCLEWMPQETIVFPGAKARIATRVDLDSDAGFIGWEILCMGLPACGQPFGSGNLETIVEIHRNRRPIFMDRLRLQGEDDLNRPAGLRGFSVTATFVVTGCRPDMLPPVRQVDKDRPEMRIGITLMDDLLVVRTLGDDSSEVKSLFTSIWAQLRPKLTGRDVCVPRIWET